MSEDQDQYKTKIESFDKCDFVVEFSYEDKQINFEGKIMRPLSLEFIDKSLASMREHLKSLILK